jgi:hypothetical protein
MHTFGLQLRSIQVFFLGGGGGGGGTDHHLLTGLGLKETKKEGSTLKQRQRATAMAPSQAAVAGPTFEDLERDLQAVLMDQNHTTPRTNSAYSAAAALPPQSRALAQPLARSSLVRSLTPTALVMVAAPAGLMLVLTCSLRRSYGHTRHICHTTILMSTSTQGFRHQWSPKRTGVRRSGSRLCLEVSGIGGGLRRSGVETRCSRCSQGRVERRRC